MQDLRRHRPERRDGRVSINNAGRRGSYIELSKSVSGSQVQAVDGHGKVTIRPSDLAQRESISGKSSEFHREVERLNSCWISLAMNEDGAEYPDDSSATVDSRIVNVAPMPSPSLTTVSFP